MTKKKNEQQDDGAIVMALPVIQAPPGLGAVVEHDASMMTCLSPVVVDLCGNGHYAVGLLFGQYESLCLGLLLAMAAGNLKDMNEAYDMLRKAMSIQGVDPATLPFDLPESPDKLAEELREAATAINLCLATAQQGASHVITRDIAKAAGMPMPAAPEMVH